MNVMVVDDSRAVRLILRRFLEELGHTVVEADNGKTGLEVLSRGSLPQVILVDWNMPEMDGVAFTKAVRATPALAGIRVMVVTTELEVSRVAEALEAGAQEYIMKPLTKSTLQDKLKGLESA